MKHVKLFEAFQGETNSIEEMLLLEQSPPFLSIFPTAALLTSKSKEGFSPIGGNDNTNIIYLTKRDDKGREIPNTKFSYKLSGSYGIISFDIMLRKVSRNRGTGELLGEVKPKNSMMTSIMKKLIPKQSITSDGWLKIKVPVDQLNAALTQLHKSKGSKAEIKIDGGVTINLKKV